MAGAIAWFEELGKTDTASVGGKGVGENTRALIIARSLAELTRLGVALGGRPFAGLAGLGDLLTT